VLLSSRLGANHQTLHIAPEPSITPWLKSISADYLSVDLEPGQAMRVMDLTDLSLADGSQSLVFCSHVLEHIPDDASAMREMRRVLRPGGFAVIQVPIEGDVTDEDPTVTDPEERLRRFGQRDHVRVYGLDIVGRLAVAGFQVDVLDDSMIDVAVAERERVIQPTTRQVFLAVRKAT
jgi:SAM-dependent methyltransferase